MPILQTPYVTCALCGVGHLIAPVDTNATLGSIFARMNALGWKTGLTLDLFPKCREESGNKTDPFEFWHLEFCPGCKDKPYTVTYRPREEKR